MKTPPFLLIDAGNTRLKWATAKGDSTIRLEGDIATNTVTTTKLSVLAKKYPASAVVLSSVVPKLVPLVRRAFGSRLINVTSSLPAVGLRFQYPKPSELGSDRIAAAVAAHDQGFFPAIIVACGTATAFTVLDAKGRLCGGAISPGLEAQLSALLGATAQLPKTQLTQPKTALAKSTHDAIRTGVMLSFQGGVKEIITQLIATLPASPKPHILLTGGNARHLVEHLEVPYKLRPLLIFEGLLMIGLRHFAPTK